jgi:hypothetical protein
MKLFSILLIFLLVSIQTVGQLNDDFSDGDFTVNPLWYGQDSLFVVNDFGELQLNDINVSSNKAYLVSNTGELNFGDTISWNFRLNLLFDNPSTSNQPRFYLTSDSDDLNNDLNGYYISLGETGSDDKLKMFRQNGLNSTLLCVGINTYSENINLKIKVIRDPLGNWTIYSDSLQTGNNFIFEASGFDNSHTSSNYCGVFCKYTSTRSTKFIFDDINLTAESILDTVPPILNSIGIPCSNIIELSYDELVNSSADITQNYQILETNTHPFSVININNTYQLFFSDQFLGGDTLSLMVSNVEDLSANVLMDTFLIVVPDTSGNVLISENFCDGNFTISPVWYGDDSLFFINSNNALQLNDSGNISDDAYLVTSTGMLDFSDSLIWNFHLKLLFNNPSSSNQSRVYLVSDKNNLKESLNGYYISIGESGADDKIQLFRQDGTSTLELCSGNYVHSNNIDLKIRVVRDVAGNWLIESDSSNTGNSFIYEGGCTDNTYVFSIFSGFYCKYTPSYSSSYVFDDLLIKGNYILDTLPPSVSQALVIGPNLLNISYSEPVSSMAEHLTNYFLISNNDFPISVFKTDNAYQLQFNTPFISGDTLILSISSIEDFSSNILNDTVQIIVPDTAQLGELLFNEILFDPLIDGSEYLEIYNNSQKLFDLKNYLFAKLNEEKDSLISFETIDVTSQISPGELLLFTKYPIITAQDYFTSDPSKFIELSGISKTYLTNSEETIYLLNPDSTIIDQFNYSENMHFELIDDPSGISLEKISPTGNSTDRMLWHSASENSGWGTPGLINSQIYNSSNNNSDFQIETKVFSPDNDGFEDYAVFSYKLSEVGFVGNIRVFDKRGRLIKNVLSNELIGNKGTITWDGSNDQGQKAAVGIYLVYFEYFNSNGEVYSVKKSVTLKTRF